MTVGKKKFLLEVSVPTIDTPAQTTIQLLKMFYHLTYEKKKTELGGGEENNRI